MPLLTDVAVKRLAPGEKPYKRFDIDGLYIEVAPSGAKKWRWKYHWRGKERRLTFGPYPAIGLKQAREKASAARRILDGGEDPRGEFAQRKGRTSVVSSRASSVFEDVARQWVEGRKEIWSPRHCETVVARLVKNVYPVIGSMTLPEIQAIDVLRLVKAVEERGAAVVAKHVLTICSQIFRFGVANQLVQSDPCRDIAGALAPRVRGHFAALTNRGEIGDLLLKIQEYTCSVVTRSALQLLAFTFVRPGNIRFAEWSEIDFGAGVWTIPALKMKLGVAQKLVNPPHIVPLAWQAVEVLKILQHFTGGGQYIFSTVRSKGKPMSDNTMTVALRRMGYPKSKMTAHGFRAMASTLLNEMGYRPDVIEAQLAHVSADRVRAVYNRAQYMEERRALMQDYADLLDSLLADAVARATQHTE